MTLLPHYSSKRFYVYVLRDPRPNKDMQPFYVGKGRGSRVRKHLLEAERHINPLMRRVLGKILKADLKPVIEIIGYFDVEADAFRREIELIAKYGRRDLRAGPLCNLTDGGDGAAGSLAQAEAMRRLARRLHADPQFVKANTERARAVLRELWTDPNFIKLVGDRGREVFRKLRADPESGVKADTERSRKRLCESLAKPDFIKKRDDGLLKLRADPAFRMAHAQRGRNTMCRLNADPEFRKASAERGRKTMAKNRTDPEYEARRLAGLRKRMTDPEYQAKRLAGLRASFARKRAAKLAAKTGAAGSTPANDNLAKALAA